MLRCRIVLNTTWLQQHRERNNTAVQTQVAAMPKYADHAGCIWHPRVRAAASRCHQKVATGTTTSNRCCTTITTNKTKRSNLNGAQTNVEHGNGAFHNQHHFNARCADDMKHSIASAAPAKPMHRTTGKATATSPSSVKPFIW